MKVETYITSPQIIKEVEVSFVGMCTARCRVMADCYSYRVNMVTRKCKLMGEKTGIIENNISGNICSGGYRIFRGGVKIENRENLGQCPNRGGAMGGPVSSA